MELGGVCTEQDQVALLHLGGDGVGGAGNGGASEGKSKACVSILASLVGP